MANISEFFKAISAYRIVFIIAAAVVFLILIVVVVDEIIHKLREIKEENNTDDSLEVILENNEKYDHEDKVCAVRKAIAPDALDPGPNNYMIINDGGRDVYIRSFSIDRMPKSTDFAYTFSQLLDYPSCTSSIFVEPISERSMSRKLDHHMNILEASYIEFDGNSNRQRKLRGQYQDAEMWAEKVESGEEKFFNVGFLFTLYADSIEELNIESDKFRTKALNRGIYITGTFGVQPEAYLSNMPFNRKVSLKSKIITGDTVKMHQMDRKSLSTVFNYTQGSFSHKDGVFLGRDMFTGKPFVFDPYDKSHDGFTILIFGKTGSGKSTTIKIMAERLSLLGYRFVAVDSQQRKGLSEGEYASLAEILNGVNFQISAHTRNIMNIFDVQESRVFIKDATSSNSGYEQRTLELIEKIAQAANTVRMMMTSVKIDDAILATNVDDVINTAIKAIYKDRGIEDGEPDSLYEQGTVMENGKIGSGIVPKQLPTISDFYRKVLMLWHQNREDDMDSAYRLVLKGMKEYVRELYYTADTMHFLSKKEYLSLPVDPMRPGVHLYTNAEDDVEDVIEVHGIRPYYDGQSTIAVSRTCPFTNIDISLLSEEEKKVARMIAIDFTNEQFIKKNSMDVGASDKLAAIFDECHENFEQEPARKILNNVSRTARKRNVSLWLSTQTVKEYDRFEETQDILKQAAVKMVCKQDYQDKEHLMKVLNITDSEAGLITNWIGGVEIEGELSEGEADKHRGEMCIVDGNKVIYVKVDYLKETEALSVETNAAKIAELFDVRKGEQSFEKVS